MAVTKDAGKPETKLGKRLREEVRAVREAAGVSQEAVADLFGWERGAVSKLETGLRRLDLEVYLRIMWFLRDSAPGHPAIEMVRLHLPEARRKALAFDDAAED